MRYLPILLSIILLLSCKDDPRTFKASFDIIGYDSLATELTIVDSTDNFTREYTIQNSGSVTISFTEGYHCVTFIAHRHGQPAFVPTRIVDTYTDVQLYCTSLFIEASRGMALHYEVPLDTIYYTPIL